ncbi:hypothetical protein BHE74_00048774 [Ensete ventricosum]|nr:hypothetical protein BHE74_00048774 [Ensete ventricosum]
MQSLFRGLPPPGGPQKESLTRQKQKGGGARLLRTHSGDEVDGHRRWDRGVGRGAAAVDEAEVPEAEVGQSRRVSADLRRRKRAGARAAGAAPPAAALRRVYGSRDRRPVGVVRPLLRAALLVGFGADLGTPPEEEGGLPPTAAALLGLVGVVFGDGLLELAVEGVERARVTALRVPPCLLQHLLRRQTNTHPSRKHAREERVDAMKTEEGGSSAFVPGSSPSGGRSRSRCSGWPPASSEKLETCSSLLPPKGDEEAQSRSASESCAVHLRQGRSHERPYDRRYLPKTHRCRTRHGRSSCPLVAESGGNAPFVGGTVPHSGG